MKKKDWTSPACHGEGGEKEVILGDGTSPFYKCVYCKGTGTMSKKKFYQVLGYQSGHMRRVRKQFQIAYLSHLKSSLNSLKEVAI